MLKKSFKDNPALNFISSVPVITEADVPVYTFSEDAVENDVSETIAEHAAQDVPQSVPHSALDLLAETAKVSPTDAVPGTPRNNQSHFFDFVIPEKDGETKSRRVQLLMQPSLHEKLKEISTKKGLSLNELIHSVLERYAAAEMRGNAQN